MNKTSVELLALARDIPVGTLGNSDELEMTQSVWTPDIASLDVPCQRFDAPRCSAAQTSLSNGIKLRHLFSTFGLSIIAKRTAMSTFIAPAKAQVFFQVKDMTSASSASLVVCALKKLDDRATVRVDLTMRRVEIEPNSAEPAAFRDAINNAGFGTVRQWPSDLSYL